MISKISYSNLVEINQMLLNYSKKGIIKQSKSCGFLMNSGHVVVSFIDKNGKQMDITISKFQSNIETKNIVKRLIDKYSK